MNPSHGLHDNFYRCQTTWPSKENMLLVCFRSKAPIRHVTNFSCVWMDMIFFATIDQISVRSNMFFFLLFSLISKLVI